MARTRRSSSAAVRVEAVRLVLEDNLTRAPVASDLDIPESSVSRWVKQVRVDAGQGKSGEPTTEERSELARLRREVRILKQEQERLKKAPVFFAKEIPRPVIAPSPSKRFVFSRIGCASCWRCRAAPTAPGPPSKTPHSRQAMHDSDGICASCTNRVEAHTAAHASPQPSVRRDSPSITSGLLR